MKRSLTLSVCLFAGCAATGDDPHLTFRTDEADRVAGTFARDGVSLQFEFSRDRDHHVLAFRDAAGAPLLVTTLEGALQTTEVLGGRFVASGTANAPDPSLTGDRGALDELQRRPEAALLDGLHEALAAADIDVDLYAPTPQATAGIVNYDGRYFAMNPGERRDWLAAGGASPTYVYVQNPWPTSNACAAVRLRPLSTWPSDGVVADPYSSSWAAKYWWGVIFTVENLARDTWWSNYRHCYPATVLVRVSPYWWSP